PRGKSSTALGFRRLDQWRTERRRHGPATLVIETFAKDEAVSGRAVTLYVPAAQLGMQVTLAAPFVSVIADAFESTHDAPLPGTLNSTRTLAAGRALVSNTIAR